MKYLMKIFKEIHLFDYSVYLLLYTTFSYYFKIPKEVQIIGCCIILLAFMNTWEIEKKQKKNKNKSTK